MTDQSNPQKKIKPQPYFTNYSANWIADKNYRCMILEERGLLWTLYNECWINDCIPKDTYELARFIGFEQSEIEVALTSRVMRYFIEVGDYLRCPELDEYKHNIKLRHEAQSAGGRKGSQIKKDKHQGTPEGQPQGVPEGSLNQVNSNSFNSDSVIREDGIQEHKEWLDAYDGRTPESTQNEYLRQSKGH